MGVTAEVKARSDFQMEAQLIHEFKTISTGSLLPTHLYIYLSLHKKKGYLYSHSKWSDP